MSSWKFSVITKESKKIKYQFYWQFYLNEKQTTMKTDEIYELTVDEYPTPEGGMISLIKNIHYPETAKRAGLEGKVLVKVFINKNGDVSNAEIIKSDHSIFDSSAINALLKTKFTPARLKGQPVNVQITIPINFKLQ
jgi:protein TonB